MQIFINILYTFSIYLLLSYSFSIIYQASKFFHITHGVIITIGAYLVYFFNQVLTWNISLSIVLSIILATFFALMIEVTFFRPLRKKKSSNLILLIASLGLYIIIQNIISLTFNDSSKSFTSSEVNVGHELFGAIFTTTQLIAIIISILLVIVVHIFIKRTKIGTNIRAISSNRYLSNIFGINSNKTFLWVFGIGSALAATAGILVAFETDMSPTMGFNLLLLGIVVMIIGGINSIWGLVKGSFFLATIQHLSAFYFDGDWISTVTYVMLIIFLIWKPLGFSGKRLKKIEI